MTLSDEENSRLSSPACRKLLQTVADPTEISGDLWADGIFTPSDLDRLKHEVTQQEKLMLLMEILPRRLPTLEPLISVLSRYRSYKPIVDLLTDAHTEQEASQLVASIRRRSIVSFAKPLTFDDQLQQAMDAVRTHYKKNFRYVYPDPGSKLCYEVDDVWVSLDLDSNTERGKTEFYRSCLLSALAQKTVVFFRGVPGSGKSTLAKLICYDWANGRLPKYDLVLFGTLAQETPCDTILDLVLAQMFRRVLKKQQVELVRNQLDEELMKGEPREQYESSEKLHTLIVLDGLDEYTGGCEELDFVLEADELPNLDYALLITTRPDGFKNVACPGVMVNLAGFQIDQQEEYVWRHLSRVRGPQTTEVEEQKMELEAIKDKLHKSSGLQKLAHTPLILTYVCLVHSELETDTIVELFEKVCLYLIRRFIQQNKGKADIFVGDWRQSQVIQSLCQLAMHGLLCNESGVAKVVFTEQDLENNGVQSICKGIGFLVSDENFQDDDSVVKSTVYQFHHKSLQDYLAAYGLSEELKKVPQISGSVAKSWLDRLQRKSGWFTLKLDEATFGMQSNAENADTRAIEESNWLKMVFEHPANDPIPAYSWQFILELAAESVDAKFAHNAAALWLSSPARLLGIEIEFALLCNLNLKLDETRKSLNPLESLASDTTTVAMELKMAVMQQMEDEYSYPQLLDAIPGNVNMHRLDDFEYYSDTLCLKLFTDAHIRDTPLFFDSRADFLRETNTMLAFNNCVLPQALLGQLCMAMKIYTHFGILKLHVNELFREPDIASLPMHWRERLPFPEAQPLSITDDLAKLGFGSEMVTFFEQLYTSVQQKTEEYEATARCRTNGKCTVGRLFLECEVSKGCQQFELATLVMLLNDFAHIEKIVVRGVRRQKVVVRDLPATFAHFDLDALTQLRIEEVRLNEADVQALNAMVSRASKLNFFGVRGTGIDASQLTRLTDVVKQSCPVLETYRVTEECLLLNNVFEQFCLQIRHWKDLDTLLLCWNKLSNKLVLLLCKALPYMSGLKLLNLKGNYITDATLGKLRQCSNVPIFTGS